MCKLSSLKPNQLSVDASYNIEPQSVELKIRLEEDSKELEPMVQIYDTVNKQTTKLKVGTSS